MSSAANQQYYIRPLHKLPESVRNPDSRISHNSYNSRVAWTEDRWSLIFKSLPMGKLTRDVAIQLCAKSGSGNAKSMKIWLRFGSVPRVITPLRSIGVTIPLFTVSESGIAKRLRIWLRIQGRNHYTSNANGKAVFLHLPERSNRWDLGCVNST